jgi:hypothetical protein
MTRDGSIVTPSLESYVGELEERAKSLAKKYEERKNARWGRVVPALLITAVVILIGATIEVVVSQTVGAAVVATGATGLWLLSALGWQKQAIQAGNASATTSSWRSRQPSCE